MSKLLVDEISDADNTGPVTVTDGAVVNRTGDGTIIDLQSSGSTVGSIGSNSGTNMIMGTGATGIYFNNASQSVHPWNISDNQARNGAIDLGRATDQFRYLYLNGGVVFGTTGGSVSSKTLDDYEEGTHQATITCSTSGTITLRSAEAQDHLAYTKVGRLVTITGGLVVDGISSPTGYFTVSLPFAIGPNDAGLSQRISGSVTMQLVSGVNVNQFVILGIQGTSEVRVYLGDGTSRQEDSAQAIIYNSDMYFNFHYFTS